MLSISLRRTVFAFTSKKVGILNIFKIPTFLEATAPYTLRKLLLPLVGGDDVLHSSYTLRKLTPDVTLSNFCHCF